MDGDQRRLCTPTQPQEITGGPTADIQPSVTRAIPQLSLCTPQLPGVSGMDVTGLKVQCQGQVEPAQARTVLQARPAVGGLACVLGSRVGGCFNLTYLALQRA